MNLNGRVAIVAGASGGTGSAPALCDDSDA